MKMKIKTILSVLLIITLTLSLFTACTGGKEEQTTSAGEQTAEKIEQTTEAGGATTVERFDYFAEDISKYVTIDPSIYKNMSVIIDDQYKVTDENMQSYIDQLVAYYPSVSKVTDRPIAEGDTVYIYFEGYIDGELFEGGSNMDSSTPSELKIGSGAFIPGFEDNLIGVVPAETSRENPALVNAHFPEDYHSAAVAGKDAVFHVVVEYINEETPSVYGEDFILNTLGFKATEEDVVAEFEKYLKEDMETNNIHAIRGAVWEELIKKISVTSYPEGEVEYYYDSFVAQYEYYMQYYSYFGYSFESLDQFVCTYLGLAEGSDWRAITLQESQTCVLQNLLFHGIAQIEGMDITDEDVQDSINYYIKYYANQGQNYTAQEIIDGMGVDMIKQNALFEKVSNHLASLASVTYVDLES